ncbi:ATP-dependent RNA helicase DDX18/HAS1 [Nematocida major]|uniref:ATP-dependent RNA helicase DDX18/HAS1 n=1 Tax=Nematocida major TaxID=1912982 RepID=UPI0020087018|nr:ATP-dependent RNA helicase DDX18/HAS1 [Nematocida major]KAH9386007.1 ATP-dependent RNA helicase DDX18/HAS1 [Nematocida major]
MAGSIKKDAPYISRTIRKRLNSMDITELTEIQKQAIPHVLEGHDLLGIANTGSGKTLSFLIPAAERLRKEKEMAKPRVLVISPTRELAMQTSRVSQKLFSDCPGIRTVLLVGGTKKAHETQEMERGCGILVCTPGRLLDHLQNGLSLKKIEIAVLDESDRILDIGFERDMRDILTYLPKKRQTLMFSATNTDNILCRSWLSKRYKKVHVQIDDKITAQGLKQSFVMCPEDQRFSLLFSFLKRTEEKAIVFFSTCASVVFHGELFSLLGFNLGMLHSGVKQEKRARVFDEFCAGKKKLLFSTDVAARGLDIPGVRWIVQYDPPTDPKEYIHRVGRTARAGAEGEALLFLLPHERVFIKYLKHLGVEVDELAYAEPRDISEYYVKTVSENHYLEKGAKEALRGYLQAYSGHKLKKVFDASQIELNKIAKSFGLSKMPKIDLTICARGK